MDISNDFIVLSFFLSFSAIWLKLRKGDPRGGGVCGLKKVESYTKGRHRRRLEKKERRLCRGQPSA
jgi:hypothetical protein